MALPIPETPPGFKRTVGAILTFAALILPNLGYSLTEVAPLEIARFADHFWQIGAALLWLYGEYKAKDVAWFAKVKRS